MSIRAEKQRLADERTHSIRLKRLRDEEGRFGALSRQKTLRKGRNEYDGQIEAEKDLIDGIESRASVREMNIRKHQPRPLLFHLGDGLAMRARHA